MESEIETRVAPNALHASVDFLHPELIYLRSRCGQNVYSEVLIFRMEQVLSPNNGTFVQRFRMEINVCKQSIDWDIRQKTSL